MAWEWSHTDEAYQNASENVHRLSRKELLTILREYVAKSFEDDGKEPSFRLKLNGRRVPKDCLAESVCEKMTELRTCDNGGYDAWTCPYGCHTVPFDSPFEVALKSAHKRGAGTFRFDGDEYRVKEEIMNMDRHRVHALGLE